MKRPCALRVRRPFSPHDDRAALLPESEAAQERPAESISGAGFRTGATADSIAGVGIRSKTDGGEMLFDAGFRTGASPAVLPGQRMRRGRIGSRKRAVAAAGGTQKEVGRTSPETKELPEQAAAPRTEAAERTIS